TPMYASSPSLAHVWLRPASESVFPGVLTLVLAGAGIWAAATRRASRRTVFAYLLLAGFACWMSFGPAAFLYRLIESWKPFSLLRAPVRLGVTVTFALAVIGGYAGALISTRRAWLAYLLVPLMATELYVPWPLKHAEPVPQAYKLLHELPRGPVVEYLFP